MLDAVNLVCIVYTCNLVDMCVQYKWLFQQTWTVTHAHATNCYGIPVWFHWYI